jgi:imidazolonepropionase-like amidohydrolase
MGTKRTFVSSAALVLVLALSAAPVAAQIDQTLVIEGGTLIDGNGGAPVPNSVVVVEGNRIAAVGPAGEVQVPDGAQVIDAAGKWVLPGLWDNQTNYRWFFGELNLTQGVTSIVDVGNGEEWSIAHREAVNLGKIRGPRTWIGVGHIGGGEPEDLTGYETDIGTRQVPQSQEDFIALVNRLIEAETNMIMVHDGEHFPEEWVREGCAAAHAANIACIMRAGGPLVYADGAARAGVDALHHARGIDRIIVRDGVEVRNNVLDNFANMDDAKAKALIELMIAEEMRPVPNFIHETPGYPRDWERQEEVLRRALEDRSLRAYHPQYAYEELVRFRTFVDEGEVLQRRLPGYENMKRFYRMFDAAGGQVLVGGDTNVSKLSGYAVHEEMEIMQEAGIPPMRVIMGATKWGAEVLRVDDEIGTIESGKLADILIVNSDPLEDIWNLRDIAHVIFNGEDIDLNFHASYDTPFRGDGENMRVVEDLVWTEQLKEATFNGGGNATRPPAPNTSPQPAIQGIAPIWARQDDPTLTMRLIGFNFVEGSRVYFDGVSIPWRWVSPTELEVTIDANLLARVGRFDVVVRNPAPLELPIWGDGTSNKAHFIVRYRN